MPEEKGVLCAGYVNWDVVLHTDAIPDPDHSSTIEQEQSKCGGSATNTALAFASLGLPTSLLGSVGEDKFGGWVSEVFDRTEVDPILVDGGVPTTVVYAIITDDADPRYFGMHEDVGDFGFDDVPPETWDDIGHVHVTSFDKDIAGELAQAAAEAGKTVSFNPSQGYSRQVFEDVVDAADVIFLNERESSIFRDRHDFAEVIKDTVIVMTHGAAGSTAYGPDGVFTHSGFNVSTIDDTIGAGDAFTAGFLTEWITATETPNYERALAVANACGAVAVQQTGAPEEVDAEWVYDLVDSDD